MNPPIDAAVAASRGEPLDNSTDPMGSGYGPGAWANRAEVPDMTIDGEPRVVPMRSVPQFFVEPRDPDPRGMQVVAGDGMVAGTVSDIWVDRSEPQVRFLEIQVASSGRTVLLPIGYARIKARDRLVHVKAVSAHHFATVPTTKAADQVTLREEDQIMAYFAAGYRYAAPERLGPLV